MTDTPPNPANRPASPVRKTARRAAQAGINVIWLVPILALIVTLAIAWNSYSNRGDLIEVEFADATGITPGETVLKFREITVGQVESVAFSEDLTKVVVHIRVDQDVAPYIDADSQFWIVRPQVSAQGVTRLDTVLTGAFIEGYWTAARGEPENHFIGLERAPLTREDAPGTWVSLSAENAEGMSEGAPVLFRGLEVGRMENLRLSEDDETVLADLFVSAPYDERLTTATVFWDTSGFSLSLGAQGVSFNVNSLASLVQGGVEFATLTSGGSPVQPGHVFRLQPDEDSARSSLFTDDEVGDVRYTLLIDNAVRGLERDADVQFQGLSVGRVTDLSVRVDEPEGNQPTLVRQQVTIALSPTRMGLESGTTPEDVQDFLAGEVQNGLRARVASAGLLGTSLMVELVPIPDAVPATLDAGGDPYPIIPSVEGEISDFSASAQGFLTRVGNLPIEEVLNSATDMMNSVTALASSQDTRAIPGAVLDTIEGTQVTIAELQEIVTQLNEAETGTRTAQLIERLNNASEDLPSLITSLDEVGTSLEGVDFTSIGAELNAALSELRDVIGSDAAAALPGRLDSTMASVENALNDLQVLVGELRDAGVVASLSAALDSASEAADAVTLAAADVPQMVEDIDAAAQAVDEFAFSEISAQAEGILADLRAMLGTEDAEQLPRNLSTTLEAASGLLNDLRDGNAAGSLNNALDSASSAADEVARAVQELPELIGQLQRTALRAESVMASYGDRSAFNAEAVNMMRELRRATEAFGSLARMIERNPRAFILGR
ncbi:intermembrane transport protein PqiB [Paracoccus tegillarcae]|uniref:Paraquat-inducible protein B n=1 Tax=Paracoccus tegillarcae TaxID=1529068 RepID=A0A2K9F265_9RHOB|nr:MlaD family protein [Paracoccus tegillarcae]AUH33231.1 paraquat-inducible protein B [Paracoccus tegillarcae]